MQAKKSRLTQQKSAKLDRLLNKAKQISKLKYSSTKKAKPKTPTNPEAPTTQNPKISTQLQFITSPQFSDPPTEASQYKRKSFKNWISADGDSIVARTEGSSLYNEDSSRNKNNFRSIQYKAGDLSENQKSVNAKNDLFNKTSIIEMKKVLFNQQTISKIVNISKKYLKNSQIKGSQSSVKEGEEMKGIECEIKDLKNELDLQKSERKGKEQQKELETFETLENYGKERRRWMKKLGKSIFRAKSEKRNYEGKVDLELKVSETVTVRLGWKSSLRRGTAI
jgi:hypothetical protein